MKRVLPLLVVLLGLAVASRWWPVGGVHAQSSAPAPAAPAPPLPAYSAEQARALRRTPVVQVYEASKDSVVNISSTQIIEMRSPWDQMFQDFFDMPSRGPVRRFKQTSVGSGFVLHAAGYIVTNAHVVARTAERKVVFADGREFPAQMIAVDQERDLAVLKIDADRPLRPLPLGRSSDLMVGETTIAVGNPMGYQNTVTAGVVSALHRRIETGPEEAEGGATPGFSDLIQTDASINPGNSGGPLLNALGELIGINTAIRGDAQNIGFAIPVDQLRSALPDLLDVERRYRLVIGAKLADDGSAKVSEVKPGSPAEQAGLKAGDAITALAGQPVRNAIDYHIALIGRRAGEPLSVAVLSAGSAAARTVTLTPTERPRPDGAKLLSQRFGLEAQPLSDKMARALGMQGLKALLVDKVEPGSPAAQARLQRGDVLIQLGRHQAASLAEMGELLEKFAPGDRVSVAILRVNGNVIYRMVTQIQAR